MREELRKSTLFYLAVIMIAASIISGLVMYYYPVSVEIGREETFLPADGVLIIGTSNRRLNQTIEIDLRREIRIDRRTTYPLRDYALLTYLFSGTGLALIVVDHFQKKRSEG